MPSVMAMTTPRAFSSRIPDFSHGHRIASKRSDFIGKLSTSRPTIRPCGVISADARAMAIRPTARKALLA
jgi:hypothetical protein